MMMMVVMVMAQMRMLNLDDVCSGDQDVDNDVRGDGDGVDEDVES